MTDFNENNQVPSAEPNTAQTDYQPPQYTQQYQQPQYTAPKNNGYQPPRYTQQYQQPQYQQPQYQQPTYTQPAQPVYQNVQMYSPKSRIAAALLAFMFGYIGVHNFYMGNTGKGVAQLLIGTLGSLLCGIGIIATLIWSIYEGVQLLKDTVPTDGHGVPFID